MFHGGVHDIVYSYHYQVIVTSGYENQINIFSINSQYFDYKHEGKLIGHMSMVTAIHILDKSPVLVSADDSGRIKLWDIRNFNCL